MASIDSPPEGPTVEVRHPFTGRARWVAAGLFLTGTLLQAIEFLLENPLEENVERVAYWTDHVTRIGLSMAAGLLAVPFLIGGFAVLVVLCLDRSPRLARTAAVFLTFAMVGLAAVHGLELAAYGLTRSGDTAAAVSVLELEDPGLPGAVLFVTFLAGAAFGTLALVAAMWWSPLLPRVVPFLVLGFAVLDFALGFGLVAHLVNVAAAAVVAWAVVTGYSRDSRSGGTAWKIPGPRSGRAARKAADVPAEHAPPPQ